VRPDRATEVVPRLVELNAEAKACIDDPREFTVSSRQFHEELVAMCGNRTLILVVGALESVWSAHAEVWALRSTGHSVPFDARKRGLEEHELLVELISAGDAEGTAREAKRHLDWVPIYSIDERHRIDPGLLVGDPRRR
jgi:GntR family transcriptional repressor for pyruvate dehydrogenase complex